MKIHWTIIYGRLVGTTISEYKFKVKLSLNKHKLTDIMRVICINRKKLYSETNSVFKNNTCRYCQEISLIIHNTIVFKDLNS